MVTTGRCESGKKLLKITNLVKSLKNVIICKHRTGSIYNAHKVTKSCKQFKLVIWHNVDESQPPAFNRRINTAFKMGYTVSEIGYTCVRN